MKNYIYYIYWFYRTLPYRWNFPKYKIMSVEETISDIISQKKSISRFGDGEFLLLLKQQDLGFQSQDNLLADKLLEVLKNRNPKFLVALPDSLARTKDLQRFARVYWLLFINTHGKKLKEILDLDYNYGNSNVTRLYSILKNKSRSKIYFEQIRTIWENRNILIIEGSLSRLGVGNDLFNNVKTLQRIICPHKNAFEKYVDIKMNAEKFGRDKLILFALGPTSTVLCSELANGGFWAIDIGHIDVEYMWMLMGTKERIAIKGRFVNESDNSKGYDLDHELLEIYRESIILDLSV
ncbi:GT-D fold domain-containing glycosyltransferase [Halpernia frigidisoli]|uniref:Glycosyltransferase, SP_1767 family n=1 Tax=Halpernia frigidisoli TaxID=1125876 RepID=A0A1I3FF01_9FLAO|nr:GT-D fold domain-containing glycosyltransferase [Halpernia frigidisoli]SFI09672.1 glycosyltransferase, SP_1767 family [Halpernia frigidisoli]